jgi:phage prohead protease, HK97 family
VKTKHFELQVKAAEEGEGCISGYASVFGNKDSYGDIVIKGAFNSFLNRINSSGKVVPVFYGHNMEDPKANIGRVLELAEDDYGLKFDAQLDLSGDTYGRIVYEQLKDGRLDSMSFGYRVLDYAIAKDATELRELELFEISVVPIPANPEARITEVKAGRAISAKNMDLIRRAYEALGELLDAYGDEDPDSEEKAAGIPVAEVLALLGVKEDQ